MKTRKRRRPPSSVGEGMLNAAPRMAAVVKKLGCNKWEDALLLRCLSVVTTEMDREDPNHLDMESISQTHEYHFSVIQQFCELGLKCEPRRELNFRRLLDVLQSFDADDRAALTMSYAIRIKAHHLAAEGVSR